MNYKVFNITDVFDAAMRKVADCDMDDAFTLEERGQNAARVAAWLRILSMLEAFMKEGARAVSLSALMPDAEEQTLEEAIRSAT